MSTRDQAIGYILEKVQELAAESNRLWRAEDEWFKAARQDQTYRSTGELLAHSGARDLHYAVADHLEMLAEAITAFPLFDELDKEFPKAAPSVDVDEVSDETHAATCVRCGRRFAESDDYRQVAVSGPNSLLFAHSEDCEADR